MCLSSNYCPWGPAVVTAKDTNMSESVFPPGTHHPTDQKLRLCWLRHLRPSLATQLSYQHSWVFWRVTAFLSKAALVIVDNHLCLQVGAETHVILTCFPSPAWGAGWPAFPQTCTWRWRSMLHLTRHHGPRCQTSAMPWISDSSWSVWHQLDQLLPWFPVCECATLSMIDWLNISQLGLKLSN